MVAFAATGRGAMGRKPVNGLEYLLWLPDALYKTKAKTGENNSINHQSALHCHDKWEIGGDFFLPWERERVDSLLLTSDDDDEKQHEPRLRV